jgi:hypothetical protein
MPRNMIARFFLKQDAHMMVFMLMDHHLYGFGTGSVYLDSVKQ